MARVEKTNNRQIGKKGFISWNSGWDDGTDLSDHVVIDLSAAGFDHTNSLVIEKIAWTCTAGIEFTLEFDASSNEFIMSSALAVTNKQGEIAATWDGRGGIAKTAAGSTGDLVITTTSAASADEINLFVWYRVS